MSLESKRSKVVEQDKHKPIKIIKEEELVKEEEMHCLERFFSGKFYNFVKCAKYPLLLAFMGLMSFMIWRASLIAPLSE